MSYQKDYILRMIEMLGELLRAIFGMISKGRFDEAEERITEAYLSMLRKDSGFFQQIPVSDITKILLEDHHYTNDHLEILAELMYAEGTLLQAKGKSGESKAYFQKSLRLFEFVEEVKRTYSDERIQKMEKIRKALSDNPIT